MKLTTLLLILPFFAHSQKIGAGFSIGYGNQNKPLMELSIGIKAKSFVIYPVNIKVHASNSPCIPTIFETRVGYNIKGFEPYLGVSEHIAGQDGKVEFKKYHGLRPAFGIIKHWGKFIAVASVSGNVVSFQVGVFGFKGLKK